MGSSPAVAKDRKPPDASGFSTETVALFPGAEHEVRPPQPRAFSDVKRDAAPADSSRRPGSGLERFVAESLLSTALAVEVGTRRL